MRERIPSHPWAHKLYATNGTTTVLAAITQTTIAAKVGMDVNVVGGSISFTGTNYGAAFPAAGLPIGFTDGNNFRAAQVYAGGGVGEFVLGAMLRANNGGGSVGVSATAGPAGKQGLDVSGLGTAGTPAGGVLSIQGEVGGTPVPVSSTQLPAALVGGRLDTNMGAWGGTATSLGQKPMATSVPVVLPSDQVVSTQTGPNTTAARANVAATGADQQIFASNAAARGRTVYNDSGNTLALGLGAAAASATSFTVLMAANSYYEVPYGYTGEVRGFFSAASGAARTTEITA